MSFPATTYRVLIASPSDLTEERKAATIAINDWNAAHAATEGIVLLPVKWETHARPESGIRPQAAINAQIVQSCDILIGMFWTRLGASTGVAESGTVEEINHFVEEQKPALLYFSDRPTAPSAIDVQQLSRLKDFEEATYKKALVGRFSQIDELQQILLRDLTAQVRAMATRHKRTSSIHKLEEAKKVTELIRLHKQYDITPEQFDSYRSLLGLRPRAKKARAESSNPFVGLYFDYGAVVTASLNRDELKEGWICSVEIAGDNYETKKFEVVSLVVNLGFDTAEAAISHGKELIDGFGVECIDVRVEEL
jgi:hypothetical protein